MGCERVHRARRPLRGSHGRDLRPAVGVGRRHAGPTGSTAARTAADEHGDTTCTPVDLTNSSTGAGVDIFQLAAGDARERARRWSAMQPRRMSAGERLPPTESPSPRRCSPGREEEAPRRRLGETTYAELSGADRLRTQRDAPSSLAPTLGSGGPIRDRIFPRPKDSKTPADFEGYPSRGRRRSWRKPIRRLHRPALGV
jgi:hypothetical protein